VKVHFESQDVLVIEKPAGHLSVPSSKGKSDPRPVAGILAQNQWGPLFPVHRLDFEVAGLLIFAKSSKAQTQLHEIWESESGIVKTYRALSGEQSFTHWPENIQGADREWTHKASSGRWESLISQGKKRSFIASHGKKSLTQYQILEPGIWDLNPITGRRHQLRLEMSRHGFPILGDVLYGGLQFSKLQDEIALVAYKIEFQKKGNLQLPDGFELGWNWTEWKQKFNP
jgi:tRNA pseudouridine32 synthase/23S rRNA pseudouridine746 synthase